MKLIIEREVTFKNNLDYKNPWKTSTNFHTNHYKWMCKKYY